MGPPIHPLQSLVSSLAHRPVSGSDTICNNPSPPLANIVFFRLSLKAFKTCMLGRSFHTLIKNTSFPSQTDVGSHMSTSKSQTYEWEMKLRYYQEKPHRQKSKFQTNLGILQTVTSFLFKLHNKNKRNKRKKHHVYFIDADNIRK